MFENRQVLRYAQSHVPPKVQALTPIRYYDAFLYESPSKIPDFLENVVNGTPFYRKDLFRANATSYRSKLGKTVRRN